MLLIYLPQNQGAIFFNLQAYYTMKLYIFQDNLAFLFTDWFMKSAQALSLFLYRSIYL
jgi:hypothetical protein